MGRVGGSGRLFVLLTAALASLGSASRRPEQVGYVDRRTPTVALITHEEAERRGLRSQRMSMRFGANQDGNELAHRFLASAAARGASWVSDLEVHLTAGTPDQPVVCITRLEAQGRSETVARQQLVYRPPENKLVMKPVTRTVTEMEYRCQMKSKPHTEMKTSYESSYDFSCKCTRSRPVTKWVHTTRMENECRHEPRTRTVTRYEHQWEQQYRPPEWQTVFARETRFDLAESPPSCAPLPPEVEARGNRLRGVIWFER
jgi:hypothetical protein